MKFFTFPNNAKRPVTPTVENLQEQISQLEAVEKLGVITGVSNRQVVALANGTHYLQKGGMGVPWNQPGKVKTWFSPFEFIGVFVDRDPAGNWAVVKNEDSVEGLQWTSRPLMDFYKLYRSHFPYVPKFVKNFVSAEEAGRLQFGDGPAADFPVSMVNLSDGRPQLNPDAAFRVKDGELEVFSIQEYTKEFPLVVITAVTPANLNPMMELMKISAVLQNGNMSAEQKYKAIVDMIRGPVPTPPSTYAG